MGEREENSVGEERGEKETRGEEGKEDTEKRDMMGEGRRRR